VPIRKANGCIHSTLIECPNPFTKQLLELELLLFRLQRSLHLCCVRARFSSVCFKLL